MHTCMRFPSPPQNENNIYCMEGCVLLGVKAFHSAFAVTWHCGTFSHAVGRGMFFREDCDKETGFRQWEEGRE